MKIAGTIAKGRFVPDHSTDWAIAASEYEGKRVVIEIDVRREVRSDRANRRYWGGIVPLAVEYLSKTRDVPLSKDQAHYVLVSAFAGCDETPLGLVPVRTSTMSTAQFSIFCEKVEAWLSDVGYYLPPSGGIDPVEAA